MATTERVGGAAPDGAAVCVDGHLVAVVAGEGGDRQDVRAAYDDCIVAACERAGFQPRIQSFQDTPVNAMLARLPGGREVGLTPASFAIHVAEAAPDIVAREIVDPLILAELSIPWPGRGPSAAVARFLDSARSCAAANG
jgi:hypothetical protein